MRTFVVMMLLSTAACRSSPPVAVAGDDAEHIVLSHEIVRMRGPIAGECQRAIGSSDWRELRSAFGSHVARLPADYAAFAVEQVVAVALPTQSRLRRIVVGTEEGVDVLTLECAATESAPSVPRACLLRLPRRPNQLAVVLRPDAAGGERTVGVFDGL